MFLLPTELASEKTGKMKTHFMRLEILYFVQFRSSRSVQLRGHPVVYRPTFHPASTSNCDVGESNASGKPNRLRSFVYIKTRR